MDDPHPGEPNAPTRSRSPERLGAFSDAVIAVIITIMVLELKAPDAARFSALTGLWPTALSYAVSYLFIAIIWINHHHLLRFVREPSNKLIWLNFLHLFLVSLVPFATQWAARTRLSSPSVVVWAGLFLCVDLAYLAFERAVLAQADCEDLPQTARRQARRRSLLTVGIFALAAGAGFASPAAGVVLICVALSMFVRPEVAGLRAARAADRTAAR
jgi:uncharacterized membrane protein